MVFALRQYSRVVRFGFAPRWPRSCWREALMLVEGKRDEQENKNRQGKSCDQHLEWRDPVGKATPATEKRAIGPAGEADAGEGEHRLARSAREPHVCPPAHLQG